MSLNPNNTAILSLHMQNDIVHGEGKFKDFFYQQVNEKQIVSKAQKVLSWARAKNYPVMHICIQFDSDYSDLFVNSNMLQIAKDIKAVEKDTWGAAVIDELTPKDNEYVITHNRVGPIKNSTLLATFQELGIENVILFGVATNVVVDTTARALGDEGYHVHLIEDACSAPTPEIHEVTVKTLELLCNVTNMDKMIS